MTTQLLTVERVAEDLSVSKSFVYKLVRTQKLFAVKIGTAVRIRPEDLQDFINHNLTVPIRGKWVMADREAGSPKENMRDRLR
jgi:excisionase family DNA binding protein